MCVCDYDPPEFCFVEMRKAAKEHRCSECCRTIVAGERYEHVRGKWDGDMCTFRTCAYCLDIRTAYEAYDECACLAYEGLHEIVTEAMQDIGHQPGWFALARSIVAARRAGA